MRSKMFYFIICFNFLFANNLNILPLHSYYTNANLSKAYNELLVYEETRKITELLNDLLKNKKFKESLYFEEMGKTKVSSIAILTQLKYFLNGWPKYTNTSFDNNSNVAGIQKILQDLIKNDENFLNIPVNAINDMKKSILNLKFFDLVNKTEKDLKNKNLYKRKNLIEVMKNLDLLIDNYILTLNKIKDPLIDCFNNKIKDKLEKDYRLYAKTSLIKTMHIFKNLIDEHYHILKEEK